MIPGYLFHGLVLICKEVICCRIRRDCQDLPSTRLEVYIRRLSVLLLDDFCICIVCLQFYVFDGEVIWMGGYADWMRLLSLIIAYGN